MSIDEFRQVIESIVHAPQAFGIIVYFSTLQPPKIIKKLKCCSSYVRKMTHQKQTHARNVIVYKLCVFIRTEPSKSY